jgi:hypothetical protein
MRSLRSLAVVVVVSAGAARADAPVPLYVNDVVVADGALAADASALTSSLCAALAKDKRVDVLCAPDVKQLLAFSATTAMIGSSSPAVETLQRRIDATRLVVSSQLAVDKGTSLLTTVLGEKDDGAEIGAMSTSKPVVVLTEKVSGRTTALLERLPGVAKRLVDAAVAPAPGTLPAQAAVPSTAPPAPLTPAPPTSSNNASAKKQ